MRYGAVTTALYGENPGKDLKMKFSGKIIISDIDGTYTGSESGIKRNNEAIRYFKENGGLFTFASGRVAYNIGTIVPGYDELVNAPCVFCNGSYLYDVPNKKRINEICLDGPSVMPVLMDLHEKFPTLGIRINCRDGYLAASDNDLIYNELKNYFAHVEQTPLSQMPLDGWNKIVLAGESAQDLEAANKYIDEKTNGMFEKSYSCRTMLELLAPGATKGAQVKYLKSLLGNVKTYCIGDYENDENMLASADVSACPISGLQKIKDMSNYVVCHCADGAIAGLIERIEAEED